MTSDIAFDLQGQIQRQFLVSRIELRQHTQSRGQYFVQEGLTWRGLKVPLTKIENSFDLILYFLVRANSFFIIFLL